jgi:hypothetical protein
MLPDPTYQSPAERTGKKNTDSYGYAKYNRNKPKLQPKQGAQDRNRGNQEHMQDIDAEARIAPFGEEGLPFWDKA